MSKYLFHIVKWRRLQCIAIEIAKDRKQLDIAGVAKIKERHNLVPR